MLPLKCLTSCEVPYLCMIACPLNSQSEQPAAQANPADDRLLVEEELLSVEFAAETQSAATEQAG